jgi:hypothetical protein
MKHIGTTYKVTHKHFFPWLALMPKMLLTIVPVWLVQEIYANDKTTI